MAVHGAVYRNAFGESVSEVNVVGEGFALRNGKYKVEKFEINSSVFNNPKNSLSRPPQKNARAVGAMRSKGSGVVEYWKTAGPSWVRQKNFEVKELLEDFDTSSFDRMF